MCWLELVRMFTDAYVNYNFMQCLLNEMSINIKTNHNSFQQN